MSDGICVNIRSDINKRTGSWTCSRPLQGEVLRVILGCNIVIKAVGAQIEIGTCRLQNTNMQTGKIKCSQFLFYPFNICLNELEKTRRRTARICITY